MVTLVEQVPNQGRCSGGLAELGGIGISDGFDECHESILKTVEQLTGSLHTVVLEDQGAGDRLVRRMWIGAPVGGHALDVENLPGRLTPAGVIDPGGLAKRPIDVEDHEHARSRGA